MNHWTLTLRTQADVYCPLCGCDLAPDSTRFRWGVAICAICSGWATTGHLEVICRALRDLSSAGDVSTCQGLLLWTPRFYRTPRVSLLMQAVGALERPTLAVEADAGGAPPFEYLAGDD